MKPSILQELTREERRLYCFRGPGAYPVLLQQYLKRPEAFAETTKIGTISLSQTKTFRHCLCRFVQSFQPEKLLPGKDLWLYLEKNGRFTVRRRQDGARMPQLSETEQAIFQYLCFLELRRFWNVVRQKCRYPERRFSVVILDFSQRLDESVDFNALLLKAKEIANRVVVIKV